MRLAARVTLVAALGLASLARAAEPATAAGASAPGPAPVAGTAPVVRVFEIRHADLQEVSLVLPTLLSSTNVLTIDRATRTVTVVDDPATVQRVADWLAQFDVPPHAVLVRIVLERAERASSPASDEAPAGASWRYVPLAETTLEVLERGTATQVLGPDGTFEVRVRLGNVDAERKTMRFDEVAVRKRESTAGGTPGPYRDVFSTAIDARDRVGKVVMATRDPSSDVALAMKLLALIREPGD